MYKVWIAGADADDRSPGHGYVDSPVLTIATVVKGRPSNGLVPWAWLREGGPRERVLHAVGELWLETEGSVEGLLSHALRDAAGSDFLLGETPETWSPAGSVDFASQGRWISLANLVLEPIVADGEIPPYSVFSGRDLSSKSPCLIGQRSSEVPVSAVAVGNDAFLVIVPPESQAVQVRVEEGIIAEGGDAYPDVPPWQEIGRGIPDPDERELLVWRLYQGRNSKVIDGCSEAVDGIHRLVVDRAKTAGVLLGRIVRVVARRASNDRSDPLLAIRRRAAWLRLPDEVRTYISTFSPPLHPETRVRGGLVVAVHGTQGTGLLLAASIAGLWQETASQPVPVARFEHDTWQRLESNATELATRIIECGASNVLLVAHSRGGLVAARALQILNDKSLAVGAPGDHAAVRAVQDVSLITLGSPFLGTPMAHAADAAWASVHALMGSIRLVGGPAVDATTRILSWTIKRTPPDGIRLMYPASDVLPSLRATLPVAALLVGGHTNDEARDFHGIRGSLRAGMGEGVFGTEDNDLVVATVSALAERPAGLTVCSDHSSYMLAQEVRDLVAAELRKLPAGTITVFPENAGRSTSERLVW